MTLHTCIEFRTCMHCFLTLIKNILQFTRKLTKARSGAAGQLFWSTNRLGGKTQTWFESNNCMCESSLRNMTSCCTFKQEISRRNDKPIMMIALNLNYKPVALRNRHLEGSRPEKNTTTRLQPPATPTLPKVIL